MESREDQISRESGILRAFQRQADEIARLIVATDLPWIDIEIKVEQLRREAERLYPRKSALLK